MTDITPINPDHWAIIRWSNGFRCGPLSRVTGGLGYHEGHVGVLALFDSATEAMEAVSGEHGPGIEHTAVRLRDMRFRLRSKYESIVNESGDYQYILQAFALATLTYPKIEFIIEEMTSERSSVKLRAVT